LATREVVEPESARIIGAMIPPERGHLVIATDVVDADVVRETTGSVDDQACEARVRIINVLGTRIGTVERVLATA